VHPAVLNGRDLGSDEARDEEGQTVNHAGKRV
jgi:hypothetical protein